MAKESMWKWACKMYYGKQLYSGHYWDNKVTLKTARKRMEKLQQEHPVFRFELADYDTNVVVEIKQPTVPKREEKPVWPFPFPFPQPPEARHG